MKHTSLYLYLLAAALLAAGCTDEKEISAFENTENQFADMVGGESSSTQWWQTAVRLQVKLKTKAPASVSAYTFNGDVGVLYDSKIVTRDSTFYLTLPQTTNRSVIVMAKDGTNVVTKELYLTGASQESIELNTALPMENAAQEALRAAGRDTRAGSLLYGTDLQTNAGYTEVNREGIETVMQYTEEGMDVQLRNLNCNYELISRGPFNITLYYGYTGMYEPRILGYYRHSPGTYQDLEFVDLVDTHSYDYINGQAKLQYQLDGLPTWYDANFDYRDGFTAPFTTVESRLGDDAYNIQHVIEKYGQRLTKARGLTWCIDVKPDDRIGFYLKMPGNLNAAQREHIIRKGLPAGRIPSAMYETNWSAKVLNTDEKHRSVLIQSNGYTIMGMEDATSTGDFDCNDVLFGLHADMESEMPVIINPEIDALVPISEKMPWTIAYEDVWRNADFDFNDAVIRLDPDYETETCNVTLMAVGATDKMYLHYDGPDGDENLGELHELFGKKNLNKINTTSGYATTSFVSLGSVKWHRSYTMAQDARRFYIEVKRGTCTDCTDLLTLPCEPGTMPQALLIAGSWHWPMEGKPITDAYKNFKAWSADMTAPSVWGWHTNPQPGLCVEY